MTRNREIRCEDIFQCSHELEIPISDNGEITLYRCLCGEYNSKTPRDVRGIEFIDD